MRQYRQGDVLLVEVAKADGSEVSRERGNIVLAHGEVTGHAHEIAAPGATLTRTPDGKRYLAVLAEAGVSLVHQEHGMLTIEPGVYEVRRQREWTAEDEVAQVVD